VIQQVGGSSETYDGSGSQNTHLMVCNSSRKADLNLKVDGSAHSTANRTLAMKIPAEHDKEFRCLLRARNRAARI
jgi:hypothetical protein